MSVLEERLDALNLEVVALNIEAKATIEALKNKHTALEKLMLRVLTELEKVCEKEV